MPWSAASCQCLTAIRRPAAQLSASATSPAAKMSAAELCHFGADDDPRLLDIKSSRFGYPTLWNDAGDGDHDVAVDGHPVVQLHGLALVYCIDRNAADVAGACRLDEFQELFPASAPSRLCYGTSSGATRVTATPRRASDAAASHPMKPALTTTAERASELAVRTLGVPERAQLQCMFAARDRKRRRVGAVGQYECREWVAVAVDDDEVTGRVDPFHLHTPDEVDVVVGVPGHRMQRHIVGVAARKSLLSGGRSCGTAGSALTRSTGSSLLCLRKASAAPTPAGPLPTMMRPASVIGAGYPERNRCNRLRLG